MERTFLMSLSCRLCAARRLSSVLGFFALFFVCIRTDTNKETAFKLMLIVFASGSEIDSPSGRGSEKGHFPWLFLLFQCMGF